MSELAPLRKVLLAQTSVASVNSQRSMIGLLLPAMQRCWLSVFISTTQSELGLELRVVVPDAQAQMGDVPLPASEAIVNAGSDAGSLAALAAVPERQPSAPSPAEFFGNIAALTSGSYGGLPVPGSLAEGPDLAGPLSLDAPGVPPVGPGPMGRDQRSDRWQRLRHA